MRAVRRVRPYFVEQRANPGHDVEIGALAVAADRVALAGAAPRQHGMEGAGVVLDMQPVAYIVAVAVDRDALAVQSFENRERDQLFGKMIGAVIVRAVAQDGRQAERLMPGAHKMIRGGIGGVGLVAAVLAEPSLGPERAEYLIGRDMVKAKPRRTLRRQAAPVIERRLE